MTIHLPPDLEDSIQAAVHRGHFASLDEAMTRAATLLLREIGEIGQGLVTPAASNPADADPTRKPIWERILERSAAIPDGEWEKRPVDGAEQHDHYIYGTPKRPTA